MHPNYIFSALALALPVYSLSSTASMGCYSAIESFKNQGPYTYQSPGYCQTQCAGNNFKVAALSRGNMCYCGNKVPSDSAKIAGDKCDIACTGWAAASCELPTMLYSMVVGLRLTEYFLFRRRHGYLQCHPGD